MTMPSRKLSRSKSRLAFVFVKAFSSLADISEDDARVESTVPFRSADQAARIQSGCTTRGTVPGRTGAKSERRVRWMKFE